MNINKKVFRSRISVLLCLFILMIFIPLLMLILRSRSIFGIFTMIGVFVFLLFIFTGIRYIISENKIQIKLWFITFGSVNIKEISKIKRSYNPLSSPAVSLKRLSLYRFGKIYALISPDNEQKFLEELKAINPYIDIDVSDEKGLWRIWDWDI